MSCKIHNNSEYDITDMKPLIRNLYGFAKDRFGFKKPPTINFVSDATNHPMLGKTAHYEPASMEITVYTDGRHPKDMMRSIAHELVHHKQNENGMFDNEQIAGEGYAQKDPHLRKMEEEAYLKGNMCFRDWEDQYKSKNKDIFYERRIRKMSTKKWKNKELSTLLNERWGFSMNLDKLNESKEITHMCALQVTHKKSGKKGHPIKHTLTESGQISHYTVEFDDVIVENIAVENLDILQQEEHSHKRDDEKKHDKEKKVVSEEELENKEKADLDGDGELSGYEKKRGKAIEKSMKKQKEKNEIKMGAHVPDKNDGTSQPKPKKVEEAPVKSVGQRLAQVAAIRDALRQGIKNSTGISIPSDKMQGIIDMVIDAAAKDSTARTLGYKKLSKVPPKSGGEGGSGGQSGAPAQVQEDED